MTTVYCWGYSFQSLECHERGPDTFILLLDLTVYKYIYLPKQNCTHFITYLSIRKFVSHFSPYARTVIIINPLIVLFCEVHVHLECIPIKKYARRDRVVVRQQNSSADWNLQGAETRQVPPKHPPKATLYPPATLRFRAK